MTETFMHLTTGILLELGVGLFVIGIGIIAIVIGIRMWRDLT
ncbi:hypothetical protein LCGC14_1196570 [marine sediment metagenome]|uniref:Uncharacterized protein n=1 Tax=marine sediment metagenome TaxID=412755 RepID=A0A0F9LIB9_9ZZZZ